MHALKSVVFFPLYYLAQDPMIQRSLRKVQEGLSRRKGAFFCSVFYRVLTGPGKPGKSWNFIIMAFSRTGKSWKKATGSEKFWKSFKLNKNKKCMEGSKEN